MTCFALPCLIAMSAGMMRKERNSFVRKDKWMDGDKELGENQKLEQWAYNSSGGQYGEARRAPSEKWGDSGNKDANYDLRGENKWSTCWGLMTRKPVACMILSLIGPGSKRLSNIRSKVSMYFGNDNSWDSVFGMKFIKDQTNN